MYSELKENFGYKKIMIILGLVTAVLSALGVLFSDICIPVASALLCLFILFDRSNKKWLSLIICAIILIAFPIVNLNNAVFALTMILCAFILFFGYKKGLNKAELAIYLTVLFVLCNVAALYLLGAQELGSYNVQDVMTYYKDMLDAYKDELIWQMKDAAAAQGELGENEELLISSVETLFLQLSNLFLAMLVIIGFFYAGIQIKVFSIFAARLERAPRSRMSWHFAATNVFAYFYIALFIISMFFGSMDSVFSIAIMNLYYIFLFVFAYVGFNYMLAVTSRARNRGGARFIFILFLLMATLFAVQILSFVGVFITTMHNKFSGMRPSDSSGDGEQKGNQ